MNEFMKNFNSMSGEEFAAYLNNKDTKSTTEDDTKKSISDEEIAEVAEDINSKDLKNNREYNFEYEEDIDAPKPPNPIEKLLSTMFPDGKTFEVYNNDEMLNAFTKETKDPFWNTLNSVSKLDTTKIEDDKVRQAVEQAQVTGKFLSFVFKLQMNSMGIAMNTSECIEKLKKQRYVDYYNNKALFARIAVWTLFNNYLKFDDIDEAAFLGFNLEEEVFDMQENLEFHKNKDFDALSDSITFNKGQKERTSVKSKKAQRAHHELIKKGIATTLNTLIESKSIVDTLVEEEREKGKPFNIIEGTKAELLAQLNVLNDKIKAFWAKEENRYNTDIFKETSDYGKTMKKIQAIKQTLDVLTESKNIELAVDFFYDNILDVTLTKVKVKFFLFEDLLDLIIVKNEGKKGYIGDKYVAIYETILPIIYPNTNYLTEEEYDKLKTDTSYKKYCEVRVRDFLKPKKKK
jgi:hypothetical protein